MRSGGMEETDHIGHDEYTPFQRGFVMLVSALGGCSCLAPLASSRCVDGTLPCEKPANRTIAATMSITFYFARVAIVCFLYCQVAVE